VRGAIGEDVAVSSSPFSGVPVAITGGARGIGRAVAERFAREGAMVAIGDIDGSEAEAAAAAIGGDAVGLKVDVSDADSFTGFVDAAEERFGPLGVLVNNAGVDWIGPFHEEPLEAVMREINVNLVGAVVGSQLAVKRMLPRGQGHIVNVASGAGRVPLPGSAVYTATKHGVVGLTEALRLEYRDRGLRFSVIQPAQVDTAMIDGQGRSDRLPVIQPEDVADAITDAVRRNRFEVWVPSSQGVSAKAASILPRRLREAAVYALGVDKVAGGVDAEARRDYHRRAFGRDS
jgi:NAD(P)-dependent dehydrogenase (short-subunit alcohol dehydrogenase family)